MIQTFCFFYSSIFIYLYSEKTLVRAQVLPGLEALRKRQEAELAVAEVKMLGSSVRGTRLYWIRDKCVRVREMLWR